MHFYPKAPKTPKFHFFPSKQTKNPSSKSSCGFFPQAISFPPPQEQNQVDLVEAARWKSPNHPRWADAIYWEDGTYCLMLQKSGKLTSWYGESTIILQGFHTCWVVVWDFLPNGISGLVLLVWILLKKLTWLKNDGWKRMGPFLG